MGSMEGVALNAKLMANRTIDGEYPNGSNYSSKIRKGNTSYVSNRIVFNAPLINHPGPFIFHTMHILLARNTFSSVKRRFLSKPSAPYATNGLFVLHGVLF